MSKTSRLARPPSAGAGSKLPSPRKECPGTASLAGQARVQSVGEKLMRAGTDRVLTRQKSLTDKTQSKTQVEQKGPGEAGPAMESNPPKSRTSTPKVSNQHQSSVHMQTKSNLRVTSPEDAEITTRRQASPNGAPASRADAKGSGRAVPRRHTLGGARSSREILAMQPPDMDKKREAFLEHLKHKYPHHASAIMGHQERLREQSLQAMLSSLHSELDIQSYLLTIQSPGRTSRSPKHCPSPQPGVDVDHISLTSLDSLEAMSEVDAPTGFTRGSRIRASLPVVRSTNQTKDRSLGVLYLQYGDETKQIRMPNEITSIDTVRALFVSAFPQMLTMKMLESPSVAVYVKDDMRNMYYELSDVRNIMDHSCLKVYHKDPAQAFSHGPRPANGDARMHGEMVNPLRQAPMGPPAHHPPLQAALPPSPHSPSRIPFGPRQGSLSGNGTVPRERLSTANAQARSSSPCPSAILERRDVKPDGDMGGKGHSLTRGNEGLYADPYLLQEARMGMATSHGPHPNPGHDGSEHGFHRASIRSTGSYSGPSPTDSIDHPSLYRQKSRNSQLPTLGSKTPPPSPHRMADVRLIDIHAGVPIERSSSVRQSFRKEDVTGTKPRNNMASSDLQGHPQGPVPAASDIQTRERMKAMEQQIASLTGLVQHALLKGPDTSGTKEPLSERPSKTSSPAHSAHSSSGSPVLAPKCNASASSAGPQDKQSPIPLKANLLQFRKNVSDLRMQLHQMRQLQLQNQEILRVQLKRAEQEIGAKLAEALRRLEDPVLKQRVLVEEDRQKYLGLEERVLAQLGDLEQYVGTLQKDSSGTHRAVTLKDVEEGAVTLRKVGESLAGLKGEFPALQTRMRAVLRVEVEAVKFLKEEPHKLDSMLKRVKSLTDMLSSLRRSASESSQRVADPSPNIPLDNIPSPAETLPARVPTAPPPESQSSTVKSEVKPPSPVVIHHVQSSPVPVLQSQQSANLSASQPSPPLTPSPTHFNAPSLSSQGRESPKATPADPPSPARHKKARGSPVTHGNGTTSQDLVIEELQHSKDKCKNRAMSIEAAEKEWEERRQNMGQYDEKEFEKILQEAEANMTKGLPSPDVESNPMLPPVARIPLESPTEPQPEPQSDKPTKRAPEKLLKPVMEKPAKPVSERTSKTSTKPTSPDTFNKLGSEKATKSPPPPPPRKTFSNSGSGMTTTRSGEVVYTNRKDSQVGDDEGPLPAAQIKPNKSTPPEPKKPATPPPVVARDEEDEGDRIMAELQSSEPNRDEKDPDTDENGNTTVRQSQGVIYYVTGKIPKEHLHHSGTEESHEHREPAQSPSQVSNVTVNDNSPGQPQQQEQQPPKLPAPKSPPPRSPPPKSPALKSPPPISPKPVGLTAFNLPRKPLKRSESLKTSAEMEKGKNLNRINTEKKSQLVLESVSSTKNAKPEAVAVAVSREASKSSAPPPPPPRRLSSEEHNPSKSNFEEGNEEASLSPDLPGEEPPPPPDNIAFMITNTKIQALSCGEYKELVNAKKGNVQTVTVGGGNNTADPDMPLDNCFNKKPVIIIFDEPIDIRAAYKRLSTIFECEEELDRMLAAERIDEESEESDTDRSGGLQVKAGEPEVVDSENVTSSKAAGDHTSLSSSSSSLISESADTGDAKQDSKKKFKFKFPKKQLAALTQAIRTGTKSGKKTLQVVVYEDEEESDGTVKQHKESKRFVISRSKSSADPLKAPSPTPLKRQNSDSVCRTNEIRKNTYKTLDSLEQTIKQLETTINEIGPVSPEEPGENGKVSEEVGLRRSASLPTSKGSALKLASKASFQKKTKPLLLPRPVVIPTSTTSSTTTITAPSTIQQNTSVASPTSRMPVPLSAKSRQSPATTDKAGKQQKLQDAQRQFRQANGSTKRVGGDHKTTSPTVPISKIPAFYPSTTKCSSDSANPTNPSPSSSSSSKSSLLPPHNARSASLPSSQIPSLSNGSLKPPSQHTAKALSFSSQTPNGRVHSSSSFSSSSSSSTSPSPLSPLGPGGKSIRTIHTPSFTSYRAHNGSSGKSCIPTASPAKD
ncbi:sickle tail protein homolog isoform X6 [Phyllopteryx taeniolatus]|uniref:sickle tail protein homolog isoform X6 n=1 Tax=Phyllopteryx taeniolatus TaxID=161469 RepID=UPI002AD353CC|nr:sickle tail protein homolog isoform X6 [Phyllopteryx taeniolatus]